MNAWNGKVVAVTGGSAGLGLQIARAFSKQGAAIAILGRNNSRLNAAVDSHPDGDWRAFVADATSAEQMRQAATSIVDQLGRIDVWINNVGVSARGAALDASPEQFRESLEVNFLTAVHGAQAAAEALKASQGSLVFIGSLASKTGSRHLSTYPAGKFALAGYAHQLRLELQADGVHVMLVCPGPILRNDSGNRYQDQVGSLPDSANQPGGGAKLKGLDPDRVAQAIVRGCEKKSLELVLPWKARLLFAIAQLSPRLGDWLLRRASS